MTYTAIHTDPDENAYIRSRFHKLVAAMCYHGVRDYTKAVNCIWWEVTLPNGVVAVLYSRMVQSTKNVGLLDWRTYLLLDEEEFLISEQICVSLHDVIQTYHLSERSECELSLEEFHVELMEYVYDYYPEWESEGYPEWESEGYPSGMPSAYPEWVEG